MWHVRDCVATLRGLEGFDIQIVMLICYDYSANCLLNLLARVLRDQLLLSGVLYERLV